MAAIQSVFGHDLSGPVANLLTVPNLLAGDAGEIYYATDTNQFYVCQGAGIWVPMGNGGNVASPGAGAFVEVAKLLTGLADNTLGNLCVVTIPNAIMAGMIGITVVGSLGDGDSSEASYWTVAFSRITGANAKGAVSAKSSNIATTGVTGNAAVTVSLPAVTGAVGAVNSFTVQAKVARSAGTSTNHVIAAQIDLLNCFGAGLTIA